MRRNNVNISITTTIVIIVFATAVIIAGALLMIMKYESESSTIESAGILFKEIAAKNIALINTELSAVTTLTETAARMLVTNRSSGKEGKVHNFFLMKSLLETNHRLMSVYAGFDDGAFYQIIAVRKSPLIMKKYNAPPESAYIEREIFVTDEGERKQVWKFLNCDLKMIFERKDAEVQYDPRKRPWYKPTLDDKEVVYTKPYIFSSSGLPGLTCARALTNQSGVFGADITLTQLNSLLLSREISNRGLIWIQDSQKRVVAFPGISRNEILKDKLSLPLADVFPNPVVKALSEKIKKEGKTSSSASFFIETDKEVYLAVTKPMFADFGVDFNINIAAPVKDITAHIERTAVRMMIMAMVVLALLFPIALFLSGRASTSIEKLAREAEKVKNFDFSRSPHINSFIREVQSVADAYESMKHTIYEKTEKLMNTRKKLEILINEGLALSREKRLDKLITIILNTAVKISNADGGVVYLKDGEKLGVELLSLGSESLVLGGLSENPAPRVIVLPGITKFIAKDSVLRSACEAFNTQSIITVRDRDFSLFPTGLPQEPTDYPIRSVMAVPIITLHDEILGVLQVFNHCAEDDGVNNGEYQKDIQEFVGALASQAAVTLDNRNLILSLQELFDALVKVVASSIDAKSPYTAGHCSRVPVLAEMLARAAHETEDGPLKNFRINDEDERRQLHLAAWLHDCGKVTTPEYVVDKSVKLETIYNRFHEIRMRFEVLNRDAHIEHLQRLMNGASLNESANILENRLKALKEDFEFLAASNEGGEFMTEEAEERIKKIAARTWERRYSDRIGISDDELRRKGDVSESEPPVTEHLLADKPEHIIPRIMDYTNLKDADGYPIQVPEHEYNRGEIYNLCISKGTLTAEERFKINEHTISGMKMLKQIPFPKGLKKTAEIAVDHHETLIGTGYPLKKRIEHLSIESRILAVADIFEALTAADRPYKKAKKLSEALKIMCFMRNDKHIDADLMDVFLKSGVYKTYAEKYLKKEQRDVDDISPYLCN